MSTSASANSEGGIRSSGAIRVVVVDDHPVFRAALASLLRTRRDMEVLAESGASRPSVVDVVTVHRPDVVVFGVHRSDHRAFETARALRRLQPQPEVLVIGELVSERQLLQAARAGVSGYLASDVEGNLFEGVQSLAQHQPYVSLDVIRRLVHAFEATGAARLLDVASAGPADRRDVAGASEKVSLPTRGPGHSRKH